ncbi:hypothetical protein [Micromonospora sp. DT227]|uniref:hypothetical protein n=1 Tax=Micromonospora sp. DT227 TaxID=3393433 RepID=UPI003CF9E7AA
MRDLPFRLADCGAPAVGRIEIYSDLLTESLDGVAYVCRTHPEAAARAITAAGLTASMSWNLPPGVVRMCGHVHLFPTGMLGADDRHPRWCDRHDCAQRGEHRSRTSEINTSRPEAYLVAVALVQAGHAAAEPVVILSATDDTGGAQVALSIAQVRALRYRLGKSLDAAGRSRR